MTTGRINQVAFLRDAGTVRSPPHRDAGRSTRTRTSFLSGLVARIGRAEADDTRRPHRVLHPRDRAMRRRPRQPHSRCEHRGTQQQPSRLSRSQKGYGLKNKQPTLVFPHAKVTSTGTRPSKRGVGTNPKLLDEKALSEQFDARGTEPANPKHPTTTHATLAYTTPRPHGANDAGQREACRARGSAAGGNGVDSLGRAFPEGDGPHRSGQTRRGF